MSVLLMTIYFEVLSRESRFRLKKYVSYREVISGSSVCDRNSKTYFIALLGMSEQKIRYRFEQGLTAQADIYHFSWREQNYEWLLKLCISVKEFYADAASRGYAMLIDID